jgi:hypothetical protein
MLYLERIPPIATLFSMRVAKIVDMLVDLGSAYLSGTLSESLFRKMLLYNKFAVREESLLTSCQMKAVILQSRVVAISEICGPLRGRFFKS